MARAASARRHAQAAFEIALERDELDVWRRDLERIAGAMTDPVLRPLLESPKVSLSEKVRILGQWLEGVTPLAMNLAQLLVAKGRLGIAQGILTEYERLVDDYRGIAHAEVTTAVNLDEEQRKKLVSRLGDVVGKEIMLRERVDPALIGGLRARVGDKLIDGSTKSRLFWLRESLIERR